MRFSHLVDLQGLSNRRKLLPGKVDLRAANGAKITALYVGRYTICLPEDRFIILDPCYYIPVCKKNIISVSCLNSDGYLLCFANNNTCSNYRDDILYASGELSNGLYILNLSRPVLSISKKRKADDSNLWHYRLSHINSKRLDKLAKEGLIDSFNLESLDTCEACLKGKMAKAPFPGKGQRAKELLELIHTDVCGPMSHQARGGFSYFITFTNDFSRYGYIYLIKHKSEALEKFKEFKNEVENQTDKKIKTLQSDRGGEYLSQEFIDYLKECGIVS